MIPDNLILINGGAHTDIKKALRQWVDLYSKDLQEGLTFQLFKNGRGSHVIQAGEGLDNERFFYLVNYLMYPEGIEYKIEIEGYTIGKDDNQLKGTDIFVYISPTDKEYDNVFVVTSENENFKVDFGGKITETREKRIFTSPPELNLTDPQLVTVSRKEFIYKEEKISKKSLENRFRTIFLIIVGLTILAGLLSQNYTPSSYNFSFFIGVGMGVWFFGDYKMLQSNKLYLYSLGIAIGYLLFNIALIGEFNKDILVYGALNPITILLIQKPTRLIFKALLKREPVVDKPPRTFWDGVYMVILFYGLVFLPFVIVDA